MPHVGLCGRVLRSNAKTNKARAALHAALYEEEVTKMFRHC